MYVTEEMYKISYKEVYLLLMNMPKEYINLIPQERIKYYYENMDSNYDYKIDYNKRLYEQEMSEITKAILSNLYRDYLATDEEKENIIKKENKELKQKDEEKRKKYNPDDLFKKTIKEEKINDNIEINQMAMVTYKETIFSKLINKIKRIFHIDKKDKY